jgi:hypothetical protein
VKYRYVTSLRPIYRFFPPICAVESAIVHRTWLRPGAETRRPLGFPENKKEQDDENKDDDEETDGEGDENEDDDNDHGEDNDEEGVEMKRETSMKTNYSSPSILLSSSSSIRSP